MDSLHIRILQKVSKLGLEVRVFQEALEFIRKQINSLF